MATDRKKPNSKTQSFYDRIAEVQTLAMKISGYRQSVAEFLLSLDIEIGPDSLILDAGSGTGIVTMALQDAKFNHKKIVALDLSFNSLKLSLEQFEKEKDIDSAKISAVQSNILNMPFADGTFDLVLTCGVLEYVGLDDGLNELARVTKKGAKVVLLPVRPSVVGAVLELLYNFKIHPVKKMRRVAQKYFRIIGDTKFPLTQPIAWSKMIFLLERK
jgi:ubiquinone/menaquinone biosynthesis C-methylase UbiE